MKNWVARDYGNKGDKELAKTGLHIGTCLLGNGNFTTPPITPAALTTQANSFNAAIATAENNTPATTQVKNAVRIALVAALDQLANYVDFTANGDAAKIASSGFNVANIKNTPRVPAASTILGITNASTGTLNFELAVAAYAWVYIIAFAPVAGGVPQYRWFTDPHDVVITGLTPGTLYSFTVQVMGSKNQATATSDAVQHMAT